MPYEYRKLGPKEREAIVEMRRQRGFPLHAPPHPFREAGSYLITAANYEHHPIMGTPDRRTQFQELLLKCLREADAEIIGWVILPNHYHVLLNVERLNDVSSVIKHVHGVSSREWNAEDGQTRARKVWYHFADRGMRSEFQLQQSLNYIHRNPQKHGLVEDVYSWEWSSLFMYVDDYGRDWLRERWKTYPPAEEFGEGWDNDG